MITVPSPNNFAHQHSFTAEEIQQGFSHFLEEGQKQRDKEGFERDFKRNISGDEIQYFIDDERFSFPIPETGLKDEDVKLLVDSFENKLKAAGIADEVVTAITETLHQTCLVFIGNSYVSDKLEKMSFDPHYRYEAYLTKFPNLPYGKTQTIKIISAKDGNAKVEITTHVIDFLNLDEVSTFFGGEQAAAAYQQRLNNKQNKAVSIKTSFNYFKKEEDKVEIDLTEAEVGSNNEDTLKTLKQKTDNLEDIYGSLKRIFREKAQAIFTNEFVRGNVKYKYQNFFKNYSGESLESDWEILKKAFADILLLEGTITNDVKQLSKQRIDRIYHKINKKRTLQSEEQVFLSVYELLTYLHASKIDKDSLSEFARRLDVQKKNCTLLQKKLYSNSIAGAYLLQKFDGEILEQLNDTLASHEIYPAELALPKNTNNKYLTDEIRINIDGPQQVLAKKPFNERARDFLSSQEFKYILWGSLVVLGAAALIGLSFALPVIVPAVAIPIVGLVGAKAAVILAGAVGAIAGHLLFGAGMAVKRLLNIGVKTARRVMNAKKINGSTGILRKSLGRSGDITEVVKEPALGKPQKTDDITWSSLARARKGATQDERKQSPSSASAPIAQVSTTIH